MKNKYELTAITSEKTTEKELPEISKKIQKIIQDKKAKIESEETLGRKKFTHLIEKNQFGTYLVFQFISEKSQINSITSGLNSVTEVLRFMVTKIGKAKKTIKVKSKVKRPKLEKRKEPIKKVAKKITKKKKTKPKITKEIESEGKRMEKLEEELGKILEGGE